MTSNLCEIREWAKTKIASGQEPPWAWYQYMKLIETVDAILGGMETISPKESSLQSGQHLEMRLRLVDSTYQPNTVQHHPSDGQVQLPM